MSNVPEELRSIAGARAISIAHKKLVVDIMYHALKDARECAESYNCFADDDHRAWATRTLGVDNGIDELREFICSVWFERLCEELDQVTADKLRDIIMQYSCKD